MTNKNRLTPPGTTPLERAFETATDKLRAPDVHTLWDAYSCPERLLPWLAWAVGVEVWDDAWPVAVRRSAIAAAMKIARHRGSVWAVKEALIAAGYAGAEIEEGLPLLRHDGTKLRDGLETYGSGNRWAMFKLIAELGETKGVGGAELRQLIALIDNAKPARSQLTEIEYRSNISDVATPEDQSATIAQPQFNDVRPAGRRRDGSLSRDNAIQLPPAPLLRNGQWQRNAEAARTGLSPYYTWEVTGETRDNRWESAAVNVDTHNPERVAVADPRRRGHATRDGAFLHGGPLPAAFDRAHVAIEPRLSDTATPDELATANLSHRLSEVRPAGRRRDGSLRRDNAIQLPPAPLLRNGQWQRNAEASRTGVSPYFGWQITGETRENHWEGNTLAVAQQITDAPSAPPIARRGAARRDGAPRRGAPNPAALDAVALTVSRRQRRNARLFRNGNASRVPHYHQHLTL